MFLKLFLAVLVVVAIFVIALAIFFQYAKNKSSEQTASQAEIIEIADPKFVLSAICGSDLVPNVEISRREGISLPGIAEVSLNENFENPVRALVDSNQKSVRISIENAKEESAQVWARIGYETNGDIRWSQTSQMRVDPCPEEPNES